MTSGPRHNTCTHKKNNKKKQTKKQTKRKTTPVTVKNLQDPKFLKQEML